MKSFVENYNSTQDSLRSTITEKPVKDAKLAVDIGKGVLYGDTSLAQLSASLRGAATAPIAGLSGAIQSLADLGITTGAATGGGAFSADAVNGKLVFDEAKFRAALKSDPAAVRTALGATSGTDGFAQQFNTVLKPTTTAGQGIADRIEQQNANSKRLTDSLTRFNDRLAKREQALKVQFAAMESALNASQTLQARMNAQLSSLTGFAN